MKRLIPVVVVAVTAIIALLTVSFVLIVQGPAPFRARILEGVRIGNRREAAGDEVSGTAVP